MADGYVTTHVLDTGQGRPAAGLRITVWRIDGETRLALGEAVTNADGRTDAPVIPQGALEPGIYEFVFHAGDYHAAQGVPGWEPRFLDLVPVRFGIADADQHYHVPLLLAPYSYATYRGS